MQSPTFPRIELPHLAEVPIPPMLRVRLAHPKGEPVPDIGMAVDDALAGSRRLRGLATGASVAVAVGSRGIAHLPEIVAAAVRHLFETLKECVQPGQTPMLIPMPDYRPKYPKINPEIEINPNHPNLTIWHNKIDCCMFVGVHCHQANLSLKIIRGGTSCYTIAMCAQAGHEDAMLSFRDASVEKILTLADWVKKLKGTVQPRLSSAKSGASN